MARFAERAITDQMSEYLVNRMFSLTEILAEIINVFFRCVPDFASTMAQKLHVGSPGCPECPGYCRGAGINCMRSFTSHMSKYTTITEPGGQKKTCYPACNSQVCRIELGKSVKAPMC